MRGKAAREQVAGMKVMQESPIEAAASNADKQQPQPQEQKGTEEEEEMPSGEDAEAAAARDADKQQPQPQEQKGTGEEEEMPSGEDAEAAAAKVQAYMRGKAAREQVAGMKVMQESPIEA